MFEREILTPSDVLRAAGPQQKIRLGGRVLACSGPDIVVGDALCRLSVRVAQVASLAEILPGFLVVFDGTWDGAALAQASLVWSQAAPAPVADGEFSRLVFDGVGARLAKRATALAIARRFFDERHFVEIETPTRLLAPGLDAYIEPMPASGGWLVTSPELHLKRLIVGGMPRVFEFARCHRADETGPNHEPEFTLLEWYRAFEPVQAVMRDTEALVSATLVALSGASQINHQGYRVRVQPPFERLTVADAFRLHAHRDDGLQLADEQPDTWFRIWVETIEPALCRYEVPVFITDYPASQAALARKIPGNPEVAERFELYCAGVELCNGFGELTDPGEQRARFEAERAARAARGAPAVPLDERFLSALGEGMPPCSGNALGFDRLVMLATGAESVAAVQAFPADRN